MASFARMGEEVSVAPAAVLQHDQDWAARLEKTIERGANHLLSLQAEEGFWQGELEADTTLESDYIYYLHGMFLERPIRNVLPSWQITFAAGSSPMAAGPSILADPRS